MHYLISLTTSHLTWLITFQATFQRAHSQTGFCVFEDDEAVVRVNAGEGIQDEPNVWILVLHRGSHRNPFLERDCGKEMFIRSFPTWLRYTLLLFCLSLQALFLDKLLKKTSGVRLFVPKSAEGSLQAELEDGSRCE